MKSKLVSAIIAIVVIGAIYGCQEEKFKVSEDGYQYKYITKGSGETPKQGEVVVYNMTYKNEKDSIIGESTNGQPFMIPCDTMQWNMGGALYKAFARIKEGDSILIKIPTKQVFQESFRADVPPSLDPEGDITFFIGATKYMTMEEAQAEAQIMRQKQQEAMLAESAEQMEKDIEIIDAYLEENNITAQSTESGLRYVIEGEGTGSHPEPGQRVFVHYTGMLLDGTKFDASFDHDPPEPLPFPIGQGQVIPGWDEGIALLKKGGKGTLYIPSPLAYGPRGAGADIPPNSVLKFEVELVDIN
jgi:FKBP-type peptidyl-prolyl cis-trans isomerase FkpA